MKILVGPLQRDFRSPAIFGEILMKILGGRQAATMKRWTYVTATKYTCFLHQSTTFSPGVWSEQVLHRFCARAAETVQVQITSSLNGKYYVVFPFCLFCLNEQNKQKGNKE